MRLAARSLPSGGGNAIQPQEAQDIKDPQGETKSYPTKREAEGDPKSQPVKPLTAYNYFFRLERERLLEFCAKNQCLDLDMVVDANMPPEYYAHYFVTTENSTEFQMELLLDQWNRDPTVKRKHCKSHGKISFQALVKRIAKGWRALPQPAKDVFREIAIKDFQRYKRDMMYRG